MDRSIQLFDTHAHLDDPRFDGIRDEVIARAAAAGVMHVVSVGTTIETSRTNVKLAERFDAVAAAVGIQPNCTAETRPGDWDMIVRLVESPEVVALGETGLDRYWDYSPIDTQRDYFDRHLQLSQQRGLPIVIHMRDCEEDVLAMLREARQRGPIGGVLHSFSGTAEGAAQCVELGLHISFAGMVTFKKADALRTIAAQVPADRLLIETDAPYLTPAPHRGKRPNEPAHLIHTAKCLADVRQETLDQLAALTTANARRLFGTRESMGSERT